MTLSGTQLGQYRSDGYLVLEDFVAPSDSDALIARANALVEDFEPDRPPTVFSTRNPERLTGDYFFESGDKIRFFFEEDAFGADGVLRYEKSRAINKIGHALHEIDPVFDRFSRSTEVRRLADRLCFADPLLLQSMYIFKQPKIGGEVLWHQDATYLYTEPSSVVGLWFALEDASVENGCLWALPGGHRLGLKSRYIRTADDRADTIVIDDTPWPDEGFVPLEVPKGTLVLFDGLLPHGSRANRSAQSRQAYTLHLIDGTCEYAADNWLQRGPDMPLRGFD